MKKHEAIEKIKDLRVKIKAQHMCKSMDGDCTEEDVQEYRDEFKALQMAEEALKDVPDTNVGKWIPCSERLPEELTPVNVTWVNRNPAIYYENIKDIPFTATAVYCNKKWFWWSTICEDILAEYGRNDAEMVNEKVEIIAWMPLPEPYKEQNNG